MTTDFPTDDTALTHMTSRVPDCRATYATLQDRGAVFVTPPVESE